jgi:very-short-patch-repair endonuclease
MWATEIEFNQYLTDRLKHKTEVGKISGSLTRKITNEELEEELRRIFEECYSQTGNFPSRVLFKKLSKYDEKIYRKRFNKSWSKVCEDFGYKINKNANKFESYVLSMIDKILLETSERQKTFDWLIGVNNFPLYCDGYYPNHQLIVETDGKQHKIPMKKYGGYRAFFNLNANDNIKDKLAIKHGIKILRIDIDSNWYDKNFLIQKLIDIGINIPTSNSNIF